MNLNPFDKIQILPTVVPLNTQYIPADTPSSDISSISASASNEFFAPGKNQQVRRMIKNDGSTSSTDGDQNENQEKKEDILSAEAPDSNEFVNDDSMKEKHKKKRQTTATELTTTTAAQITATINTSPSAVSIETANSELNSISEATNVIENKNLSQLLSSSLSLKTQRNETRSETPIASPSYSLGITTTTTTTTTTIADLGDLPVKTIPTKGVVTTNLVEETDEHKLNLLSLSDNLNCSSSNLSWTSSIATSLQNSLVVIASGLAEQDLLSKINESEGVILRHSIAQVDTDKTKISTRLSLRAKKKSWYNVLYPNYKSRSEDFKKLFKEVPNEERLIVDYSCALQREILVQGRMYVSQNYVCFHANIFRWETYITIKWEEVTSITKEKTALVIPNAISICTDKDKYFFATFTSRDKAYLMLFRIWQNTLMKKAASPQEIWKWVHNSYGEELGLTTDDEDYIDPNADNVSADVEFISAIGDNDILMVDNSSNSNQSINILENCGINTKNNNNQSSGNISTSSGGSSATPSIKTKSKTKQAFFLNTNSGSKLQPNMMATSSNSSSDNKGNGAKLKSYTRDDKTDAKHHPNTLLSHSKSAESNKSGSIAGTSKDIKCNIFEAKRKLPKISRQRDEAFTQSNHTDRSASSDSDENKIPYLPTAVCNAPHEGRQILHSILPMNIECVFNMMFSNSKFLQDFHAMRRTENLVFGDWISNNDGSKSRVVNLTVQVSASIGPKVSQVTENQFMRNCSKPNELYSIDVVNTNSGIPYADRFCVMTHFCLVRTADDNTMLSMHAQIKYMKSIWGVVKSLIEKNTWAGIEEYYTCLLQALQNETNLPPAKGKCRRPRRGNIAAATRINEEPSTLVQTKLDSAIDNGSSSTLVASKTHLLPATNHFIKDDNQSSRYRWLTYFILGLLISLIILNVILLRKLWSLEELIDEDVKNPISLSKLSELKELPTTNDEWLKLLQQQEKLHDREMKNWHTVLQNAIELLKKVSVVCQSIYQNDKPTQDIEVKPEL